MFRKWGSAVVCAAMIVASTTAAFGGTGSQHGALAPGGSAGVKQAQMWDDNTLLIVLILAMVMEQLQIAPSIVLAAFSIIFGGIVIALVISFGVGGIDAARRMIENEAAAKRAEENKDEIEHI